MAGNRQLRQEAEAELRDLLREVEWGNALIGGGCRICNATIIGKEHFPDCRLAKVLHSDVRDPED